MLKIVVVDDELDTRDDMVACIDWHSHGMEVAGCADDGPSALALIRETWPDVVLIDIQMPGMSGLEVIETLREENGPRPAFIVISGYDDFSYAQRAIHLDVDEYLLKPFRPQDVIAAVQKSVERLESVHAIRDAGMFFPFYASCADSSELEGPIDYPAEAEQVLNTAILTGASGEIDEGVRAFFDQVFARNGAMGQRLNCCLMLYANICRLLAERGSALHTNCFTGLEWSGSAAGASMRSALAIAAQEAHVILGNNSESRRIVNQAMAYIGEHYADDLSLELVAQRIYVTAPYLSSLFSKQLHVGFVEYVHQTRIARAKQLLASTDLRAQDVAQQVGYGDTKYFSAVFKKQTGLTPTAFRGQTQNS